MAKPAAAHEADRQANLERAASLAKPLRYALYEYVVAQSRAVGRDEAAAALGVTRALAAFHLDRLVRDGLLQVEYRRLSGRSGPGAGRPAKLYRRGPDALEVSVPDRRYRLAAEVLAATIETLPAEATAALEATAESVGRRIVESQPLPTRAAGIPRERLLGVLGSFGFEPRTTADGAIELSNCPFHGLRAEHSDVVCGMNRCLVQGMIGGARGTGYRASLEPCEGRCCVVLRPEDASGS